MLEEETWEKLQRLVQRIGEDNKTRFLQRVKGLIDRASSEYYDMHPDKREGEGWII